MPFDVKNRVKIQILPPDQQERDRHPGPDLEAPHQRGAFGCDRRVVRGRSLAEPPGRRRLLQQRDGDGPQLRRLQVSLS